MKKTKVSIALIAIALLGFWAVSSTMTGQDSGLPPLHTEIVGHGDVSQRVVAYGTLQPVHKVTVGSQVSGIIENVYVDFNTRVRRGQVLAQIDPSTFKAQVSSAEAELEAANAALELARIQHARMLELKERQFVAKAEVDQARASLQQAKAQLNVRQHALDRAKRELERCTIASPTDGIVISRNVDVGQTVAASLSAPELFQIAADLTDMWIHANVSEADIGLVAEGQKAEFRVDAYRNRTFEGVVIQVRNAPIIADNVVHYETIIQVDNRDLLLKPGMTSEVSIIVAEVNNTARVRNTALRARLPDSIRPVEGNIPNGYNGRVYVVRNGQLYPTPVKAGLSDGLYTQILDGVAIGDTLAVGLALRNQDEGRRRSILGGQQAQC